MLITPDQWADLATRSKTDSELFSANDATAASVAFITELDRQLDYERDVVTAQAMQLVAEFWAIVKTEPELSEQKKGWGYFGIRGRRRGNSLELAWFKTKVIRANGVLKSVPDPIAKGRGPEYSLKVFKSASPQAYSLIEETERQCVQLRKQWDGLTKMTRQLREYKKLFGDKVGTQFSSTFTPE